MSHSVMQGTYVFEKEEKHGFFFKVKQMLYDKPSQYQHITVFDSYDVGRVLMLDHTFNVSTEMEEFYHEPMAHIPVGLVENAKDVLIIGGGDFGVAKHLMKHKSLNSVTKCELDGDVIKVCREFFPEWTECEKDHRFHLLIGDGFEYLKDKEETYDAIIVDSTDPYGSANILISPEFYQRVYQSLKPNGVLMQIMADVFFYKETWPKVIPTIQKIFDVYQPIFIPIPLYSTIFSWGILLLGKGRDSLNPSLITEDYLSSIPNLKTMTVDLVKSWFSMPPYIQQFFNQF